MHKLLAFTSMFLTCIIVVHGQDTLNQSYLAKKITSILALDEKNECMFNAINNKEEKFKYYLLKKTGYYFDEIDFYRIVFDSVNYYQECEGTLLPYCHQYIIAVIPNANIYRMYGFEDNDFNSFYLDIQRLADFNLKINNLINNHFVEGLDFKCLYEGTKEKSKFNKGANIGKISYKYPCLLPCKRGIIVQ